MWRVQLFKLNYDEQEQQAVKEVLDSAWLTMGQKTLDFESAFAEYNNSSSHRGIAKAGGEMFALGYKSKLGIYKTLKTGIF